MKSSTIVESVLISDISVVIYGVKTTDMIPVKITKAAEEACAQLLPERSKPNYELTYKKFLDWKVKENIKDSNEEILLAYYNELSKKYAPSIMWSFFSMLKSTIRLYENVDIQKYGRLQHLLKSNCKNYQPKKSKVFTAAQTDKFLAEAPDDVYLATKVAAICGIWGTCRSDELVKMKIQHIKEEGRVLIVDVPDTKTKKSRRFVIAEDNAPTVKKYRALRPQNAATDRFFLNYRKGKCTIQAIGKHKFTSMPHEIARFLNLEDPENYTGHAFRRTSATLLADSGVEITDLKRHGGWKSNSVAEGYIEESLQHKIKIGKLISSTVTSAETLDCEKQQVKRKILLDVTEDTLNTNKIPKSYAEVPVASPNSKEMVFHQCSVVINYHGKQ